MEREAWSGRRYPAPTAEELVAARRRMEAPIVVRAGEINGYRCDDCDEWEAQQMGRRLRYGCSRCGARSFSPEKGIWCPMCGCLVPITEMESHREDNCG